MIASNSLKEPMLEWFASICIGSRYFASSVAEMIDFKASAYRQHLRRLLKALFTKIHTTLFGFLALGGQISQAL